MMSSGVISFPWADGNHIFRLPIERLVELQDKCDAGPVQVLRRLGNETWRVSDVRETIRLGLVGGGMPATEALLLVTRYVVDGAWIENAQAAAVILMAALAGRGDDPVGKPKRRRKGPTPASSSPVSTDSAA